MEGHTQTRPGMRFRVLFTSVCSASKSSKTSRRQLSITCRKSTNLPASSVSTWDLQTTLFNDAFFVTESAVIRESVELMDQIGEGSYGVVFRGIDTVMGEAVAVKRIPTRGDGTPGSSVQPYRIAHEVEMLQSVSDCPSVATFKRHLRTEMFESIVTELCDGGNLAEYLFNYGPLCEAQLMKVSQEAIAMLLTCHQRKILHGDIKASNFVIRSLDDAARLAHVPVTLQSGWLKAIDFGSSMRMGTHNAIDVSLNQSCAIGKSKCTYKVGTPTHWAPEVFAERFGLPADMWSLGIMLYQLVTNRLPFAKSGSAHEFHSQRDLHLAIVKNQGTFGEAQWDSFSSEAKDFITQLLQPAEANRLTVEQALSHPFLNNNEKTETLLQKHRYY